MGSELEMSKKYSKGIDKSSPFSKEMVILLKWRYCKAATTY